MREFLPTVEVSRGLGAPVPLPVALDGAIDAIRFTPTGARAPMTWKASLAANYTDGLVVLHRGRVVYEFYAGELREDRSHAAMSVAKSLTGTLAAMLAAEGVIEPAAPVTRYVPELAGSAFVTARITPIRKRKSGSTPRPAIHCRSLARRWWGRMALISQSPWCHRGARMRPSTATSRSSISKSTSPTRR